MTPQQYWLTIGLLALIIVALPMMIRALGYWNDNRSIGFDETTVSSAHLRVRPRPNLWNRFSYQARQAVYYAQEEAYREATEGVTPVHLLLGTIRDDETVAAQVLERLEVSREHIREELHSASSPGEALSNPNFQLTEDGKRAIDRTYEEARKLQSEYVGSQHLLLGLLMVGGETRRILREQGIDEERLREVAREFQR